MLWPATPKKYSVNDVTALPPGATPSGKLKRYP